MPNLLVGVFAMENMANIFLVRPKTGPDANIWTLPIGEINDGETIRNASIRLVKEQTGIDLTPKMSLFFCERVEPNDHRIGVFVLGEAIPVGIHSGSEECRKIDIRTLGELQQKEGLSDFAADAFVKFSNFLKSQAPTSGTVN